MFASNSLPLPSSFGQERHPLRLTSDPARTMQPQGGCHYDNSSGQSHRCSCQLYQHDRRAPGNVCDCGHSACYHSLSPTSGAISPERIIGALVEKVKALEDHIARERETRKDEISRERQLWEREARVLREALSPIYSSEQSLRRKLVDLEDKIDGNYDEQIRLKERVMTIEQANSTLERHIQILDDARGRKRKASISTERNGVLSPESNYTSASSVMSETTSSSSANISPQPPSPITMPLPLNATVLSPRSSGVLNHRATSRHKSTGHIYDPRQAAAPASTQEPRSSGFLSIDLAQRLRKKQLSPVRPDERLLPVGGKPIEQHKARSPSATSDTPMQPSIKMSSGAIPVSGLLSDSPTKPDFDKRSLKKRRQVSGMMALDVLASASVASPLA